MTVGIGSSSAYAASETDSLSVQFPSPETVNPSDECLLPGQTEPTLPCHEDELQAFLRQCAQYPLPVRDLARGELIGEGVMRIPLVNAPGRFALIDAEDYPLVQRYRWRLEHAGTYAVASITKGLLRMHRLIMMVGPSLEVDHKSRETLDNRKDNLRACTHAENMWNMKRSSINKSGAKGVVQHRHRFMGTVTARKVKYVEWFDSLEEASNWVTTMRAELHGEFARHA